MWYPRSLCLCFWESSWIYSRPNNSWGEFKRAFSGSIMHDFFNILAVAILFPIEMKTHYLEKAGLFLSSVFNDMGGAAISSPIKIIVKPAIHAIDALLRNYIGGSNIVLNIKTNVKYIAVFYNIVFPFHSKFT